jgi:hypothetical protein
MPVRIASSPNEALAWDHVRPPAATVKQSHRQTERRQTINRLVDIGTSTVGVSIGVSNSFGSEGDTRVKELEVRVKDLPLRRGDSARDHRKAGNQHHYDGL